MAHQNAWLPITHYPWPTSEMLKRDGPFFPIGHKCSLSLPGIVNFSNHRTHGPLDEIASNCHSSSVKTGHSFHPRSNMAFLMKTVYHGWWLVVADGPSQKKWIVIVSLTPCPIQGAVMPASCASMADEPTWLRHQMVLNHHGHYVTVIILTCPEWWGKLGQSDVCWVNMMTNKDSRFWFAMGPNHYECQTSQCGLRVVDAKCISKKLKSINQYASADMRLDSTFTPSTPMHPSPQSSLLSSFSRAPRPDPYTSS